MILDYKEEQFIFYLNFEELSQNVILDLR